MHTPVATYFSLSWFLIQHCLSTGVAADPAGFFGKTNINYLTGWATGLRDKKGLNLTALAVAYNERTYSTAFIKEMRQSLNNNGALKHT
eukprot:COSAG02_NODE_6706_length_3409_cov_1.565257_2_plen_89_part_00